MNEFTKDEIQPPKPIRVFREFKEGMWWKVEAFNLKELNAYLERAYLATKAIRLNKLRRKFNASKPIPFAKETHAAQILASQN